LFIGNPSASTVKNLSGKFALSDSTFLYACPRPLPLHRLPYYQLLGRLYIIYSALEILVKIQLLKVNNE